MSKRLEKIYIPYEGNEPYLFLRFSPKDSERVKPVLDYLYMHSCRVWYFSDNAKDIKESEKRQQRMNNAYLTVAVLTENAVNDSKLKSDILYCAAQGEKYILLKQDNVSNLSMGLSEDAESVDSTEDIIRTEGFTADLIGDGIKKSGVGKKRHLVPVIIAVLLSAAAICVAGLLMAGNSQPQAPEDVKTLYLDTVPEDPDELDKYPNLEKIVIPQSEADKAAELMERFEIVITD